MLIVKVVVARYQPRGLRGVLATIGITIFPFSFTLVAVNVVSLLLRNTKDDGVPVVTSATFVLVVLAVVGTLLLRRRGDGVSPTTEDMTEVLSVDLSQMAARKPEKSST